MQEYRHCSCGQFVVSSNRSSVEPGLRDYNKLYFNILDYTGSATRSLLIRFDGEPAVTEQEMTEIGETVTG